MRLLSSLDLVLREKINNKIKRLDEILWVSHWGDYVTLCRVGPEIVGDGKNVRVVAF